MVIFHGYVQLPEGIIYVIYMSLDIPLFFFGFEHGNRMKYIYIILLYSII
jgi:hypothetical protein